MQIKCPHCGFSRDIPDEKIPERSELATCPKCSEKFRFRVVAPDEFQFIDADEHAEPTVSAHDKTGFYGPDARLHDKPKPASLSGSAHGATTDAASDPDGQTDIPSVLPPFEDLDNYGFFPGISQSIKRAMLAPKLFFEIMPLKGMARPLIFALLLFEFYLVLSLFWNVTGLPPFSELIPGTTLLNSDVDAGSGDPVFLFMLLPLMFVLNLFLSTALLHGVLMLLRAAPRGFEATFRASAYSYAALILSVLPYGYLAGWFWSLFISVIGCAAIHRTQTWRVALAFVLVAGFVGMIYFSTMQLPHPGVQP